MDKAPNSSDVYRGRLAPSPTGWLHLGHARTFWIAQQRARASGGVLVLRDEDLDRARCQPEYAAGMIGDLRWFGFDWQEGPDVGGPFGPYNQSERRSLYLAALEKLRADGFIYPCTCSRQDVLRALQAPHAGEDEPVYPGTCRPTESKVQSPKSKVADEGPEKSRVQSPKSKVAGQHEGKSEVRSLKSEVADEQGAESKAQCPKSKVGDGPQVNWRFRVLDGEVISFIDGHYGPQQFTAGRDFGDFIVWRHDDIPAYQLAVVVDDAAMRITEVVRGEDLLKSTARQILLYRALGAHPPRFYHCPLLTDEAGVRLAKRQDALSLRALRAKGLAPESLRHGWEDI